MFRRVLAPDVYAAEPQPMLSHINVGTGKDISIRELANLVAEVTGFRGVVRCGTTKPDGTLAGGPGTSYAPGYTRPAGGILSVSRACASDPE